ncbi:hypothetical protein GE115_16625 [Agromyces sp. CFH 90414]|uniref:4'-phosphopantetheinyl transferase superfamily protein n=1 Tax=Agromyces agglutinans TaxID=2662258 RepID=A0A6I2FHP9_9MICO|nr:4'-phosphopantetheinyl transferase superfamily protein [Agromyces agglutinans]MRG61483.1 hypothetical protein [Agromyces agglutinans]
MQAFDGVDEATGARTWTLESPRLTLARIAVDRGASTTQILARLVGTVAGVPEGDVELEMRCAVCGARHGVPVVDYPATPSGGRWIADVAADGGLAVAAVGTHRLGVAVGAAGPEGATVDAAAFHPGELERLSAAPEGERAALRTAMWVRKAALARALGHGAFLEPARVELGAPDGDARVRLERGIPELGAAWRDVLVHDVPGNGRVAAAVAVLP